MAANMTYSGSNGIKEFSQYECYMLLKYGKTNTFGQSGKREYLIDIPIYPEEVTEQISAKWVTQNILGRSAPISAYAGTDLKSVNFSIDLHRDLMTGSYSLEESSLVQTGKYAAGGDSKSKSNVQVAGHQLQSDTGPFKTRKWYVNINKMLQMSCYPQYTNNGLIPPTTYFIFGNMILKGYVNSYSTSWKKPIINAFYGWNSVTIAMECYPDTIISASDIIQANKDNGNSGAMSTQNTYNTRFPTTATSKSDVQTRNLQRNNLRGNSLGGNPMYT